MAKFKKGNEKKGGRQPGSLNKLNKTFKELVSATVDEMQGNPSTTLLSFAKAHPKEFWQIAAKLIPTELSGKIELHEPVIIDCINDNPDIPNPEAKGGS